MTTVQLSLTSEESKWLDDWSVLSGYKTSSEGIREVLKVCGAIPKGSAHWKEHFDFAE
jgi:hypothetical protein